MLLSACAKNGVRTHEGRSGCVLGKVCVRAIDDLRAHQARFARTQRTMCEHARYDLRTRPFACLHQTVCARVDSERAREVEA